MVPEEFQRYIRRNRLFAAAAAILLIMAGYFLFEAKGPKSWELRVSAGDALGARHRLAEVLAHQVQPTGIALKLVPTAGSEDALAKLESGDLDLALVQGGLEAGPNVRQVAALYAEPLHLFVRPELEEAGIGGLVGKRINIGAAGSGTRKLATEVLGYAGLVPGRDFKDESASYEALRAMPTDKLPDAVLAVLGLPADFASFFVQERGYRLIEIPFGEGLAFRDFSISDARIPLMTYSVTPPVPPRDLRTVGNQLLIVARADVPPEAINKLLDVLFDGAFARAANLPFLSAESLDRLPEMPLHEGTELHRRRNKPLLTTEAIDNIESMRSFIVSMAVALFLIWRWYSRRHAVGFEKYLNEVTEIEKKALKLEAVTPLDLGEAERLRARLGELKTEAIDKFALGVLKGEEFMNSFLVHVTDVRSHLNAVILYERERRDALVARGAESPTAP